MKFAIKKQKERFLELSQKTELMKYKKLYKDLLMEKKKEKNDELLSRSLKNKNKKEVIDQNVKVS